MPATVVSSILLIAVSDTFRVSKLYPLASSSTFYLRWLIPGYRSEQACLMSARATWATSYCIELASSEAPSRLSRTSARRASSQTTSASKGKPSL
jgi:hypothetical protein